MSKTRRQSIAARAVGNMHRPLNSRTVNHSRWFAEITAALRETERLLSLLEANGNQRAKTARLRQRVKTVRTDLERLNQTRVGKERVLGPAWPIPNPLGANGR